MKKELSISLLNKISEISRLGELIDQYCSENKIPEKLANEFNLSLDEILTNIISYGYKDNNEHTITIDLISDDNLFIANIKDDAQEFNPLKIPEADTSTELDKRRIGGLGLHIVKRLMDSVEYQFKDGKNILTLKKRK